jgi:transcriptional regulator GlxA family with amidase domain
MASKTSAVADEPIDVLFALHPKFNLLDFAGPLEVLTSALHDAQDPSEFATDSSLLQPPHVARLRGRGLFEP